MQTAQATWFQRYLLPGFVLKSVIIGGGYATGREFAEFFMSEGPWGGLIGIVTATLMFSLVYGVSLEFARLHHSFEYRSFFKQLLGRGWVVFEALYIIMMFLVMSVIGATCGTILHDTLGVPSLIGTVAFMGLVALIAFYGTHALERVVVLWSFVLYGFYIVFVVLCLIAFGDKSMLAFANDKDPQVGSAVLGGIKYAGYNISAMTAALFCAMHLRRPGDALIGGLLGGPLAMLPGLLFYIAMVAFYPSVLEAVVPMNLLLGELRLPVFQILFLVVLFGTLICTGAALIHAVNERLAASRLEAGKEMPDWVRGAVALLFLTLSVFVADQVGLVQLVEKGYGIITFAFIIVFAIPVLTVGVWKILRARKMAEERPEPAYSAS